MDNVNWKNKFEELKQEMAKNKVKSEREKIRVEGKTCPFMSNEDAEVTCLKSCIFYRPGKRKGYECLFTELGPLSWSLRGHK